MKDIVFNTIMENKLINEDDNILVGVSGGADSMTLLYILKDFKRKVNFNLTVAHINHGIRGEESDGDEEYVKETCSKLDIPFYSIKVDMDQYAKENKLSPEEAGREIRYSFFRKILKDLGKGKIAVAHNKNDQSETLLMRFIRGTGIDGLVGMEYINNDIIRPLLDISRDEIESYCKEKNIKPRVDSSNLKTLYRRNKIRLELIPYLENNFNRGIINTLNRTSKLMAEDSNYLNSLAIDKYRDCLKSQEDNRVTLDNDTFILLHPSMKSRVLRLSIEKILGNIKGVEEKHIQSIIYLSKDNETGKNIVISNDIRVRISYGLLILEKNINDNNKDYLNKISIGSKTYIETLDKEILSYVLPIKEVNINLKDRFIKYFDYDKIVGDLFVRNRKNGDKFTPIGMKGRKKLKDFFIDEKIPRDIRDKVPLIVDNNEIVWIVGYRISENYKINDNTKNVLVLEYN